MNQQRTNSQSTSTNLNTDGGQSRSISNQLTTTSPNTGLQSMDVEQIKQKLTEGGKELLHKIQSGASVAGTRIRASSVDAGHWVKANPLKAIALGVGASFLISKFFSKRSSRSY